MRSYRDTIELPKHKNELAATTRNIYIYIYCCNIDCDINGANCFSSMLALTIILLLKLYN